MSLRVHFEEPFKHPPWRHTQTYAHAGMPLHKRNENYSHFAETMMPLILQ